MKHDIFFDVYRFLSDLKCDETCPTEHDLSSELNFIKQSLANFKSFKVLYPTSLLGPSFIFSRNTNLVLNWICCQTILLSKNASLSFD